MVVILQSYSQLVDGIREAAESSPRLPMHYVVAGKLYPINSININRAVPERTSFMIKLGEEIS